MKKIIFITMFILTMMLSTCFAASIDENVSIYDRYMSYDMAKHILDNFKNSEYFFITYNSDYIDNNSGEYYRLLNSIDYKTFAYNFNSFFFTESNKYLNTFKDWEHIAVFPYYYNDKRNPMSVGLYFKFYVFDNDKPIKFYVTNNTKGNQKYQSFQIFSTLSEFGFKYDESDNVLKNTSATSSSSSYSFYYSFRDDYIDFNVDSLEQIFDNPFYYSFGQTFYANVRLPGMSDYQNLTSFNNYYLGIKNLFNGVIQYFPVDGGFLQPKAEFISNNATKSISLVTNFELDESKEYRKTYVYLQKLSPDEAVQCTYNFSESHLGSEITLVDRDYFGGDIYSYESLVSKMEKGYIYRLIYWFNQKESEVSFEGVQDWATSEFFSLNDWSSNKIIVKNLSKYVDVTYPVNPDISGDRSGDVGINIGGYIDSVNDNIRDTILGTEDENGNRTGGLLGGIKDFFLDLLKKIYDSIIGLIIPTTDQFGEWITKTYDDVNKTGGILLYSKQFWLSLLGLLNNDTPKDLIFDFKEIKFPNTDKVIWEGTQFNLTQFVNEHEVFKEFYIGYIVIISGVSIFLFCQYLWSLWEHIINGTGTVEISENEEFGVGAFHAGGKMQKYVYSKGNKRHYRFR